LQAGLSQKGGFKMSLSREEQQSSYTIVSNISDYDDLRSLMLDFQELTEHRYAIDFYRDLLGDSIYSQCCEIAWAHDYAFLTKT